MTEFKYERSKEAVKDYLKTVIFKQNIANKALIIALMACMAVVAIAGIVYCVITGSLNMLAITIAAVIIAAVYPILLTIVINYVANKMSAAKDDEKDVTIGVSDSFILLIRNNTPCGKIEWTEISEIHEGKTGFFLTVKENEVLILDKGTVVSGTYDEAVQVLKLKQAAIKND